MTLNQDSLTRWSRRLADATVRVAADFPGERPDRQPVHTVYGGAHLFSSETAARLGELASGALAGWLPDPSDLTAVLDLPDDLVCLGGQLGSGTNRLDPPVTRE